MHAEFQGAGGAWGLGGRQNATKLARAHDVHPQSVELWKRSFVECAPDIPAEETTVNDCERRIRDLERLLGKKEVDPSSCRYGHRTQAA